MAQPPLRAMKNRVFLRSAVTYRTDFSEVFRGHQASVAGFRELKLALPRPRLAFQISN